MGGVSTIIAARFKKDLDLFTSDSRGKINHNKSQIYGWNMSKGRLQAISRIFLFPRQESWTSFKYIGMPISLSNPTARSWQSVLSRFKSKFQQLGVHWLNPIGITVLIKSVLTALPIFQCFALLALVNVMHQLAQKLRKYLWQEGNAKKFHLVNWTIVSTPKEHGRVGIKDPLLTNLALGAKLLSRLISDQNSWRKRILQKKIFSGKQRRCLDSLQEIKNGSSIWKLIKEAIPLLQSNLSWFPGNGQNIRMWLDRKMGKEALGSYQELIPLKDWMDRLKT